MSISDSAQAHALAARFQASPGPRELAAGLADFRAAFDLAAQSSSHTLEVYASIFTAALVPLFISEPDVVAEFVLTFSNAAGLGALLSRLALAPQHECDALLRVLERVLEQPGIVGRLVRAQPKQASSLVFGSRILNVAASKLTASWTGDARRYTAWLALQLAATPTLATDAALFDRAAKLGAPAELVQTYLQPEHFGALRQLWPALRKTQQHFLLSRALLSVLPPAPGQAGRVLLDLAVDAALVYDVCLRLPAGLAAMRAAVVLARESGHLKALVAQLVADWSSKVGFECSTLAAKQTLAQLLLASCCSLSASDAAEVAHSPQLLEGVSLHLSSSSANVRKIGTLVAETFAKQAGQTLEFGITYDEHEWWLGFDAVDAAEPAPQPSHFQSILHPPSPPPSAAAETQPGQPADSDDDDYADSDEEVVPPFYIKDLVTYLQSEKYGEVHAALTTGASLIARKAQFGSEVPQYAADLLRVACALTDKFSITRFAELRQGILDAVVAADAKQAPVVVAMFKTGDWSLAQRQSLLSALVFAAHELAQGQNKAEFERLPPALHQLFVAPEDRSRFAVADVGRLSINGAEQRAADDGTVVRRSRRLQQQAAARNKQEAGPPRPRNRFSAVSHMFFFPLVAAEPPLRASSYDALIYAQWLRTLGVIVVEAYPTQHMPDMVRELWPVLVSVAVRGTREVVIEEALYTCLLMVVTVAGGIIIQAHAVDVGMLLDKIFGRVQECSEPRTQQLAAATGRKLAELAAEIERRVLGSTAPA